MEKILPRAFYLRDGYDVARDLLGQILVRDDGEDIGRFLIVETECYCGPDDKGAHTFGGKITPRTKTMFEAGGVTYIYLIYGMYNCLNIVSNEKGIPHGTLIRAVEPLDEAAFRMCRKNRVIKSKKPQDLTNGPGKLCKALDIDRSLLETDVTVAGKIYVVEGTTPNKIVYDKRINIDYAEEYKDKLWRFYIANNAYVSVLKKGE